MTTVPMPAPRRPLVRWGVVAWLLVSIGLIAVVAAAGLPLWLSLAVLVNGLAALTTSAALRRHYRLDGRRPR